MYKKFLLVSFVLALGITNNALADLVAHWKLDEGSGNTVYDSSTSGNDGTFAGDPQWVAGYYGGALEFDGTDDNIDCGNDDSLNITDEITLSAWIIWHGVLTWIVGSPFRGRKTHILCTCMAQTIR